VQCPQFLLTLSNITPFRSLCHPCLRTCPDLSGSASFTRGGRLTPHFLHSCVPLSSITVSHELSVCITPDSCCSQLIELDCTYRTPTRGLPLGDTTAIGLLGGCHQYRLATLAGVQGYSISSARGCVYNPREQFRKVSASTPIVEFPRRTRKARDLGSLFYSWDPHPEKADAVTLTSVEPAILELNSRLLPILMRCRPSLHFRPFHLHYCNFSSCASSPLHRPRTNIYRYRRHSEITFCHTRVLSPLLHHSYPPRWAYFFNQRSHLLSSTGIACSLYYTRSEYI